MPQRNTRQNQPYGALIEQHRPLVSAIARRYASSSPEPLEDLIQEGLIGLLQAAQRYDSEQQVPFSAFARLHIRGAILHHMRDRLWCVRLPRRQAEQLWSPHQGPVERRQSGTQATALLQRWQRLVRPLSLEGLAEERGDCNWDQDLVPEQQHVDPQAWGPMSLHPTWQGRSSNDMLATLEPTQRRVVHAVVLEGLSYRRTGQALGISAATVQRVLHRGLGQLRERLSGPSINPVAGSTRHA